MEFGLKETSRVCRGRHGEVGIAEWANWAFVRRTVCVTVTSRSRQPCERMSAPVRYHRRRPAMVTKTVMITMMTKIVLQKSQPPISRRRQPTSETSAWLASTSRRPPGICDYASFISSSCTFLFLTTAFVFRRRRFCLRIIWGYTLGSRSMEQWCCLWYFSWCASVCFVVCVSHIQSGHKSKPA